LLDKSKLRKHFKISQKLKNDFQGLSEKDTKAKRMKSTRQLLPKMGATKRNLLLGMKTSKRNLL